jgi:hypothetical protein
VYHQNNQNGGTMKNFLAVFFVTLLLSTSSYATGLFVGADALFANADHKAKNFSSSATSKNGNIQSSDKVNYGINAGFRFDLLNLLASAELFYDDLGTSAKNFESSSNQNTSNDSIAIKNRYGAKANFGFAILPRITPFLTYGLTDVNYSSEVLSNNQSLTKSKLTPLYGLGILLDLPLGFSVKASYDYQQFNMHHADQGTRIKTNLGVAKLGVIYNF